MIGERAVAIHGPVEQARRRQPVDAKGQRETCGSARDRLQQASTTKSQEARDANSGTDRGRRNDSGSERQVDARGRRYAVERQGAQPGESGMQTVGPQSG